MKRLGVSYCEGLDHGREEDIHELVQKFRGENPEGIDELEGIATVAADGSALPGVLPVAAAAAMAGEATGGPLPRSSRIR